MPWNPTDQRKALEDKFDELAKANRPEDAQALEVRCFLIGWLYRTPQATEALYRSVLARAMESGVVRPPIKYGG